MNPGRSTSRPWALTPAGSGRQRGLTLVELLVALVLGSLIALAAVSSLMVARRGFTTVDAASQLRDNSRFASELIQRVAQQSGLLDIPFAVNAITDRAGAGVPPPYVFGANNAKMNLTQAPVPSDVFTQAGINGSDLLVMRYQTVATVAGGSKGDRSTINCAGITQNLASKDRDDLVVSVFHLAVGGNGEPSLMCSYQDQDGVWQSSAQPIIQGVESFQVLYGVDGATPNNATLNAADSVAERYLRADQIVVAGNAAATNENWRRVRSLRLGMVLRGPVGSAQERGVTQPALYPLGPSMSVAADPGTNFVPPDDGRLRQAVTYTVYLRNYAGL